MSESELNKKIRRMVEAVSDFENIKWWNSRYGSGYSRTVMEPAAKAESMITTAAARAEAYKLLSQSKEMQEKADNYANAVASLAKIENWNSRYGSGYSRTVMEPSARRDAIIAKAETDAELFRSIGQDTAKRKLANLLKISEE